VSDLDRSALLAARLTGPGGPYELTLPDTTSGRRFAKGPFCLRELYDLARRRGDRPWLTSAGRSWSVHQIFARADDLQAELADRLTLGDEVALGSLAPVDWVTGFIAVSNTGATPVLSTTAGAAPRKLVREDRADSSFSLVEDVDFDPVADAGARSSAADNGGPLALVAFTSGTTAAAKRVETSQMGLLTGLRTMMLGSTLASLRASSAGASQPTPARRPRVMLLSPLWHVGGYSQVLLSLMGGPEIVFADSGDATLLAQALEREGITYLAGVTPDVLWPLVQVAQAYDLSALSGLGVYGLSIGPRLADKLRDVFPALKIGASYGLTETSGAIAFAAERDLRARPGTCGLPAPNVEIRVCADNDHAVPVGETGRIRVRGPMLMAGYRGAESGLVDGWFDTGDRGWRDEAGFVYLAPRHDASFQSDAGPTSASQIVALIEQHPAVMEAAVVATGVDGQDVAAFVTALGDVAEDELTAWLTDRLPLDRGRLGVRLLPTLPRTASGKVSYRALQASAATARA
jgi:acyl-CoA synthetase (AMP-forming)/AMP-acid ligase II